MKLIFILFFTSFIMLTLPAKAENNASAKEQLKAIIMEISHHQADNLHDAIDISTPFPLLRSIQQSRRINQLNRLSNESFLATTKFITKETDPFKSYALKHSDSNSRAFTIAAGLTITAAALIAAPIAIATSLFIEATHFIFSPIIATGAFAKAAYKKKELDPLKSLLTDVAEDKYADSVIFKEFKDAINKNSDQSLTNPEIIEALNAEVLSSESPQRKKVAGSYITEQYLHMTGKHHPSTYHNFPQSIPELANIIRCKKQRPKDDISENNID